jgi:hypothetical protein
MAKTSPVRVRQDLVDDAAAKGRRSHRSTKAQVEYWIMIGKRVDGVVDPDTLLDLESGTAILHVESAPDVTIDSGGLFGALAADRESGQLAESIATKSPIRYRASRTHAGYLDRVDGTTRTVTRRGVASPSGWKSSREGLGGSTLHLSLPRKSKSHSVSRRFGLA